MKGPYHDETSHYRLYCRRERDFRFNDSAFLIETGEVKVLTKACEDESNSYRAQGGIAAAVGVADSPNLHWQDTLRAGVDLCDEDTVRLMVKMAPDTIRLLADWGTPFDKKGNTYLLAKEGAHSASRILRVHGDSTGAGITSTLLRQAKRRKSIHMQTHTMVADLLVENETCRGVIALDTGREPTCYLARKGVVLATGGCGQVFKYTTNDLVTTGDGFAMAHRANVQLTDMEFIQFHPTALAVDQNPMFLISEAVRGEGAVLVTESGDRFMERYHELKDLAPRDVVSRAIYTEMQQGNQVYLDARHLKGKFAHRFPAIYKKCRKAGIDPEREWIPVRPAAHFIMGGIKTDSYGRTSSRGCLHVGKWLARVSTVPTVWRAILCWKERFLRNGWRKSCRLMKSSPQRCNFLRNFLVCAKINKRKKKSKRKSGRSCGITQALSAHRKDWLKGFPS